MADATLFDDTFTITSLNAQKYDRVSRITGTSADSLTVLSLDVNTEIYPVNVGEPIQLVLASTLNLDGSKEDPGSGSWREIGNGKKVRISYSKSGLSRAKGEPDRGVSSRGEAK